jgi:hypothetical protein
VIDALLSAVGILSPLNVKEAGYCLPLSGKATLVQNRQFLWDSQVGLTPITINTHFPEQAHMKTSLNTQGVTDAPSTEPSVSCIKSPLNVSGYLDTAVRRYTEWQQSRFESGRWKDEMAKVCDEVLEQGLSLDQKHKVQLRHCQPLFCPRFLEGSLYLMNAPGSIRTSAV